MMAFLIIFYYVFGILFYDCIPQIQLIDEIMPWVLFSYAMVLRKGKISLPFIIFFAISFFYLAYSFIIHSNVPKAILFDFVVQIKPFVTLFSVMMIAPKFTSKEMAAIRYTMLAGAVLILCIGLPRVGEEVLTYSGEILTGARFSFAALYSGVCYLVFSEGKFRDLAICVIVILLGLLYPTSKYIAGLFLFIILFAFSLPSLKKFRLLMTVVSLALVALFVYVSASDFSLYLGSDQTARASLYITSGLILKDYFPLGSGLASFATSASASSYSGLYSVYGIDIIDGLTESDVINGTSFIADTGIAALAQFGIIGLFLLISFGVWIIRNSHGHNTGGFHILTLFILSDIILESIADSTMIGNRGLYMMLLLGLLLSNRSQTPKQVSSYE